MIGRAVNALRAHRSKQISQLAQILVRYVSSGAFSYLLCTSKLSSHTWT